ncbi:hypothetical protein [Rickettsiales endosymbiont of Stachyamoeba lipophora]|uniref:hypothetical protein n=1 Tax=Rickettsiales endosymbiont of Stachyamoeba lipophora TaxID=2486578 RepID=UPI000F647B80|nr:hypothetical protein [Rickettsiales endosymbiont of Stachyamoeba lipophora]AZL15787.1 hypothetical protein EF513_04410 [Rickettsiales endosymbiont of Stachyamoeba lipophora]
MIVSQLVILSIALLILIIAVVRLPGVFDRLLLAGSINNLVSAILLILSLFFYNSYLIDIVLIYVLTAFIASFAILKFFSNDRFL